MNMRSDIYGDIGGIWSCDARYRGRYLNNIAV